MLVRFNVSYITYSIISKSGIRHYFKKAACFSGMRDLHSGIGMLTHGKWESCIDDPLDTIIYYIQGLHEHTQIRYKELKKYLNYLHSHPFWGTMIENKDVTSMINDGVIVKVGNHSGAILLSLLTLLRNVDEIPKMITSFYNMTSLDYVKNEDIAILLSNFFYVDRKGKVSKMNGTGFLFNSNHHLLSTTDHSKGDIVHYASFFPSGYLDGEPFNKVFKLNGVYNLFRKESDPTLYNNLVWLTSSKFKSMILNMQKEVEEWPKR